MSQPPDPLHMDVLPNPFTGRVTFVLNNQVVGTMLPVEAERFAEMIVQTAAQTKRLNDDMHRHKKAD